MDPSDPLPNACQELQSRLPEILGLDGEPADLAAPDRAALERHAAGCARCQAELEAYRSTVELVRALPRHGAPQDFLGWVKRRAEGAAEVRPLEPGRRARRPSRRLLLAAGLLLGATLGLAIALIDALRPAPEEGRLAKAPAPAAGADRSPPPAPVKVLQGATEVLVAFALPSAAWASLPADLEVELKGLLGPPEPRARGASPPRAPPGAVAPAKAAAPAKAPTLPEATVEAVAAVEGEAPGSEARHAEESELRERKEEAGPRVREAVIEVPAERLAELQERLRAWLRERSGSPAALARSAGDRAAARPARPAPAAPAASAAPASVPGAPSVRVRVRLSVAEEPGR
ncbi:MAG: zf-HC2 domain-containing protein [Planctomycetes bacterium]|nr:zf-HC2 domain-containing protein [Planctomycetota bacterium]